MDSSTENNYLKISIWIHNKLIKSNVKDVGQVLTWVITAFNNNNSGIIINDFEKLILVGKQHKWEKTRTRDVVHVETNKVCMNSLLIY